MTAKTQKRIEKKIRKKSEFSSSQRQKYFLTYSQSKRTKSYFVSNLERFVSSEMSLGESIRYVISEEPHKKKGIHFHILILFGKKRQTTATTWRKVFFHDRRFKAEVPNISVVRNYVATLQYLTKTDSMPTANFDYETEIIRQKLGKTLTLYEVMETEMKRDPYGFNLDQYLERLDLTRPAIKAQISKVRTNLSLQQIARCNRLNTEKPGFQRITPELIERTLTPVQKIEYAGFSGFQIIVDHLNQAFECRSERPFKRRHLLLVGRPDIGKTSLVRALETSLAVYPMGVSNWFPRYRSNVYTCISWNQFRLSLMPYTQLLQFLEGSPMDLEYKGGSTLKNDNPLVIMTSNLRLKEHVYDYFYNKPHFMHRAQLSLSARITQVQVPEFQNLFLLQKLLVPVPS